MNRRVVLILAAGLMGACGTEAPAQTDLQRALAGDRNLTYANLTGANLSGAYLVEATLSDATLTGANLTGVRCDATTRWPAGFTPPPTCTP